MSLIPVRAVHLEAIAHLHANSLAGDFLPSLGVPFLHAFYRTALQSGTIFGYVDQEDLQVVGFVLASPETSALFRKAILGPGALRIAWAAIPSLLRQPQLLLKVAETFLYPGREGFAQERAELLVIAVRPDRRGQGVGKDLVNAMNAVFRERGIQSYKVTVLQSNQQANYFYQRLGFRLSGEFRLYRREWNLYTYRLETG